MNVTWLTTIADIVNIVVIANKRENGNEYSVVVGPNETTVEIVVDPAPYNITVIVFDICWKNYSSERVPVDQLIESSSVTLSGMVLRTSAYLFSSDTPGPSMQCIQGKAAEGTFVGAVSLM